MKLKLIIPILLLAITCRSQSAAAAFGKGISKGMRQSHKAPQFHQGLIITKMGTIKGLVKFSRRKLRYKEGETIRSVKIKHVQSVRLFDQDSLITNTGFTDYVHFEREPSALFRKIYSGSFEIYDCTYYCNEIPGFVGDYLIILDSGKIFKNSTGFTLTKKYLVEYINQKFSKNFAASDFKTKLDIINWVKANDK